jgi:hypothetical protein
MNRAPITHRLFLTCAIGVAACQWADNANAELGCPPGSAADLGSLVDEIESLPEGGWLRVNANRYDDVWTPPALRPSSGALLSTPSKIIQAWSSFAWDCRRGDLLLYGGGHANYSGNDTYRWRASTRLWERMSLPSDIRIDNMGNTTAIDGPFAAPPAAHTYDNNIYLPVIDRFLVLGGSAWNNGGAFEMATGPDSERLTGPYVLDLSKADGAKVGGTTGSHVKILAPYPEIVGGQMWQNRDLFSLHPPAALPSNHTSGTTAYAGTGVTDVVLLTARQGLGTAQHLFRYELSDADDALQDRMTRIGRFVSGVTGRGAGAYDPDLNVYVRTAIGSTGSIFFYWDLNKAAPDNPNVIFVPTDLTADWKFDRGYGLDFDPVRGQYLLWGGTGDVWALRAPATASAQGWTIERVPSRNMPETPTSAYDGVSLESGGGVLGKWKYIPELDAFLGLQDTSAGNVWIYKPVGWVRPGSAPPPTLNLTATPSKIFAGDDVVVSWRTKGATTCTASGNWSGVKGPAGNQTITPTISDATFTLRCDGENGRITRSVTVSVDPLAPPTIDTIAGDACVNATEAAAGTAISGTGKPTATVNMAFESITRSTVVDAAGRWLIPLTGAELSSLPDGTLTLRARQTIAPDTVSQETMANFTKDTIVPQATTTTPQLLATSDTGSSNNDRVTRDATPTFQGVTSSPAQAVALRVNESISATGKSDAAGRWKITAKAVPNGMHRVSAEITDSCGNSGSSSQPVFVTIDTAAPALAVDTIAGDNRINLQETRSGIEIRGMAEAAAAITLRVSIAGNLLLARQSNAEGPWAIPLTAPELAALPDGALSFKVSATDLAGNARSVSRAVTKDTLIQPPTISPISADDILMPTERLAPLAVFGLAEPSAKVLLNVNGWSRSATASLTGAWSLAVPTSVLDALPIGPVPVSAQATDRSGNTSQTTTRVVSVAASN